LTIQPIKDKKIYIKIIKRNSNDDDRLN